MIDVTSDTDITGTGTHLGAGDIANIEISWPNDVATTWEPEENYYIRIVPNPGQFLEFPVQAPYS
jgi:hypothetical protein